MDVKVFSNELIAEFKSKFPESFKEDSELINQLIGAITFIAALAIEKHERESHADT